MSQSSPSPQSTVQREWKPSPGPTRWKSRTRSDPATHRAPWNRKTTTRHRMAQWSRLSSPGTLNGNVATHVDISLNKFPAAIPYSADALADPNLQDGNFAPISLFGIDQSWLETAPTLRAPSKIANQTAEPKGQKHRNSVILAQWPGNLCLPSMNLSGANSLHFGWQVNFQTMYLKTIQQ